MKYTTFNRLLQAVIVSSVLSGGQSVLAQSGALEEIIVTAQKREQSIQDVALSLTALTGDSIDKLGMEGFQDWAEYVPGLTMFQGFDANRRTGPSATIRGVTHTGQGQLHEGTSSITTSFAMGEAPVFAVDPFTYDLNRIEVMRGPQGTLFGLAAMGGVIRFIPNDARADEFEAEIGVGGGIITHGDKQYKTQFMANVPIIEDVLAVRVAGQYRRNDGYVDYILPDLDTDPTTITPIQEGFDTRNLKGGDVVQDANSSETTSFRLSLTYTPTDRLSIKSRTTWQDSKQDAVAWADHNRSVDEPVVTRYSLPDRKDDYVQTMLEASYDMDFGTAVFVGSYYDSNLNEKFPFTTRIPVFLNSLTASGDSLDLDGPGGLPRDPIPGRYNFPFATNTDIWTGEVRLQGDAKSLGVDLFGNDLTMDYVIGGFYQNESRHGTWGITAPGWNGDKGSNTYTILSDGGFITGATGGSDYESKAAFFDLTFHLTQKLSIGGGLRYYEQKQSQGQYSGGELQINNGNLPFDADNPATWYPGLHVTAKEDGLTPRGTIQYDIDDERMVYFTAAKGQRMGQNAGGQPDWPADTTTTPECVALVESLGLLDDIRFGTDTDTVWSYEVGLKSQWLDNRLTFNTSAYQIDWTDFQQTVLLAYINPACTTIISGNVGAVRIRGFETEMRYDFADHFTFNTAVSYTDAQFVDPPTGVRSSIGTQLEDGDTPREIAPWTVALGLEYHRQIPSFFGIEGSGYIRADWRYVDERNKNFGDLGELKAATPFFFADSYNLVDVRAGIDTSTWSAQFYIANLLDRSVMYESNRSIQLPNIRTGSTNQPRTVGFQITKRF